MSNSIKTISDICTFCYKSGIKLNVLQHKSDYQNVNVSIVKRFVNILDRFSTEDGRGESLSTSSYLALSGCCKNCLAILEGFCNDYHKLKCLELQLEWQLVRLENIMDLAGRVPARTVKLKEVFENNPVQIVGYSTTGRVQENSSESLLAAFTCFRQKIIKKCSARMMKAQPRVLIKRSDQIPDVSNVPTLCKTLPAHDAIEAQLSPSEPTTSLMIKTDEFDWSDGITGRSDNDCPALGDAVDDDQDIADNHVETCGESDICNDECMSDNGQVIQAECERTVIRLQFKHPEPELSQKDIKFEATKEQDDDAIDIKMEVSSNQQEDIAIASTKAVVKVDPDIQSNDANIPADTGCGSDDKDSDSSEPPRKSLKKIPRKISTPKTGRKDHKCRICSKIFTTNKYMKSHLRTVHTDHKYHCTQCDKTYKRKADLKRHQLIHAQGPSSYKCETCGQSFCSKDRLNDHIKAVHEQGTPLPCTKCDKIFYTKHRLRMHTQNVHAEAIQKCSQCDKSFRRASHLRNHQLIHNDTATWNYACGKCGKRFPLKRELKIHNNAKVAKCGNGTEDTKVFNCRFCPLQFKILPEYKAHVRVDHIDTGNVGDHKLFQCETCDKKFLNKLTLQTHTRLRHSAPTHKCLECGKNFTRRQTLNTHALTHQAERERKFQCSVCGKMWFTQTDLKHHLALHGQPVVCQFCGKVYPHSSALRQHVYSMHKDKDK